MIGEERKREIWLVIFRSRLVSTRPRTTTETTPSSRTNVDRNRRPYNRSRSRFTTTTEEYHESAYEPTRSKIPETTVRYNGEHRRPTSRTHKYRNRDKISQQSEVHASCEFMLYINCVTIENY